MSITMLGRKITRQDLINWLEENKELPLCHEQIIGFAESVERNNPNCCEEVKEYYKTL